MYYVQKLIKKDIATSEQSNGCKIIELLRVRQWIKNIFVLAGVLTSLTSFNTSLMLKSISAFFLFCGISSTVYIVNDIIDIEKDKLHPVKKFRALSSGAIKVQHAILITSVLGSCVLAASFILNVFFGIIVLAYLLINLAYSLKLKEYVIIDLIIITTGFVLRTLSGMIITRGQISYLFLLTIVFLMLFLGFNKRKKEIILLNDTSKSHRKSLGEYSLNFINEANPMLAACAVISHSFYVIYELHSGFMVITIPIVLYGVLRYQYILNEKSFGENPEQALLKDKPMGIAALAWGISYIIFYLI